MVKRKKIFIYEDYSKSKIKVYQAFKKLFEEIIQKTIDNRSKYNY